ncbi:homoserine kinase [Blastococcus saxobsidens]|uniref:Homoserine kinase n=1 Tax=Blastococcus saxobsidens (strain DD2) TaxID=1146883 RepID=H6RJ20_BLASD|nr:homoserine kinase [Blastococcus saxobsidens]CCG04765.1 Homoserine kinase [Blastococcus saxobsidens DD2]
MSRLDPYRVRVRVPATSANLGPAFDCAGLALAHHDVLHFSVQPSGLAVEVSGVGAGELPTDESHLVVRAFRAACAELGWTPPGLRVVAENAIPQGRGMGSSAAAVVAGIRAAWELCPDVEVTDGNAVLRLATAMEGHPDNVAACLLGGLTLSWTGERGVGADSLTVHQNVLPVVLVPDATLSTEVARGLLPDVVPHADAAFNAGRSALLVHVLTSGDYSFMEATEDRLHQRQRAAAMPDSLALVDRLRAAGHAAVISGAGPSVLVLGRRTVMRPDERPGDSEVRAIAEFAPEGWSVLPLEVDPTGARVDHPFRQVSSR